ncbi:hypothetical protein SNOG_16522 [Parastagonospora nodorum SN15]|uniref:Uncharacterized protein n=1 Tax=Phaeosphaeria nodorum (strain SN15 / ATCC MYA-4574 / FGSC 10173) TaxID=321614 RepID=Q0TVE2_PHANO|nr:hypothetical protein SNOG_16522 [Parastagonospora nodorum SN15]EAT76127.2 hypothetical protein SNOG_16522 [Parastagonospora nodorum SN15]
MSAQPNSRAQASGSLPDTQTQAGPSNQKNAQRIQETPEVEQRFEEIDDEFEDVVTGQNNPDEPKSPSSATANLLSRLERLFTQQNRNLRLDSRQCSSSWLNKKLVYRVRNKQSGLVRLLDLLKLLNSIKSISSHPFLVSIQSKG